MDVILQRYQAKLLILEMKNKHINLSGNVLILTDRLIILALTLGDCIKRITDLNFIGVITNLHELKEFTKYNIDYLIIADYLEYKINYNIINKLRCENKNMKTVQWSILDYYIKCICNEHKIFFQFDRRNGINEFSNYLLDIKEQSDHNFS